jgi:hypothetical protein
MKTVFFYLIALAAVGTWMVTPSRAVEKKQNDSKLEIVVNETGQIAVRWNGKAVLAEARGKNGHFKKIHKSTSPYVVTPTGEGAAYRLESESGSVYSVNVVGYANLRLPPGLSLIANPLYYTNNDVALWLPNPPDGSQVYKYTANGSYEVSTYDGIAEAWSNPIFQVPIGEGFFFQNNSDTNLTYTFIGEVLQGCLTNSLPEGFSTKGALVPQSASLADHLIAGEIGDELRTYTNDLQGGGDYTISVYTVDGWTPNLNLGIGQGFWIYKQNPQNWVRCFWVN